MKKLIKNPLFTFIVGGILFSSLTILAYSYNAKDISYTPSNSSWKVNNIKSAIDSIKSTNDTTISSLQSDNQNKQDQITNLTNQVESGYVDFDNIDVNDEEYAIIAASFDQNLNKKATINLDKGKYILNVVWTCSYLTNNFTNRNQTWDVLANRDTGYDNRLEYDGSKITIRNITSHGRHFHATAARVDSFYQFQYNIMETYLVDVNTNNSSFSFKEVNENYNQNQQTEFRAVNAIKLK